VLIVEDDPRIAELHRRFTEKVDGFEVVGVATGFADAEEQAAVLEPDLVLLDYYLPKGHGLELLQKMRAAGSRADVILITAARESDTLQEGLRGGVFDYIIKPVIFSRFEAALGKFAAYRARMAGHDHLNQDDVDRFLRAAPLPAGSSPPELPKGIDSRTLEKVCSVFDTGFDEGASAEAVGAAIGVSRSTARRYLEYLVSAGQLVTDARYGTVGRPERRYQRKTH
jgi:two-component system CitB family response regulator/two-component system response regulator DcuR